jgi:hypothetical protein
MYTWNTVIFTRIITNFTIPPFPALYIVKYTELGDKEHKDSSYNQLIISIAFPPDSMYLTIPENHLLLLRH